MFRKLFAALMIFGLLAPTAFAQSKYALIAGINEYQHQKLPRLSYAVNDARELSSVLRSAGYSVTLLADAASDSTLTPTKANLERAIKSILGNCKRGDTALIALAGHGLQFEGDKECYFCPADARPFKNRADSLIPLSLVYNEMEGSFAGIKVLMVDACRSDPDTASGVRSGISSDSAPRPPQGVAALFSCRAGERAFEHDQFRHGVFFYHVLKGLRGEAKDSRGNVTFASLASYVSQEVSEKVPQLIGGGAKQSPNLKADYSVEPVLVKLWPIGSVSQPEPKVTPPMVENMLLAGEIRTTEGVAFSATIRFRIQGDLVQGEQIFLNPGDNRRMQLDISGRLTGTHYTGKTFVDGEHWSNWIGTLDVQRRIFVGTYSPVSSRHSKAGGTLQFAMP